MAIREGVEAHNVVAGIDASNEIRARIPNLEHDGRSQVQIGAAPYLAVPYERTHADIIVTTGARFLFSFTELLTIVAISVLSGVGYNMALFGNPGLLPLHVAVGLLAGVIYSGGMHAIETNHRLRRVMSGQALRDITLVWIGTILLVTFFAFSLKSGEVLSRGAILWFTLLGYVGVLATRAVGPKLIAKGYEPGRLIGNQVLVIGAQGHSALRTLLSELNAFGYSPLVVAFDADCDPRHWQEKLSQSMSRVMALARATRTYAEICIAAGGFSDDRLRDVVAALGIVPRAVRIVPDPSFEHLLHLPIFSVGTLRSLEVQRAPLSAAQRVAKRALDIVLATLFLILLSPLFLILAVLIRLNSLGPLFFRQLRLGHCGKAFYILKFRTMTVAEDGPDIKPAEQNDPRVTRIGRWLRRLSLDELPQLINVIRGEMSLVGPRPHAVAHDEFYATLIDNYEIRQHVKPGITGWAQVNGFRGSASIDLMRQRVEFDMWYAKHASLRFDIKILLLTVIELFRQRNAY